MSYNANKIVSGRKPFEVVEIDLDRCALEYGKSYTNLFIYSEQFDNSAWTKTRTSISADAALAPDGTISADKLIEDTSNNSHYISDQVSVVNGRQYTLSVYAKEAERSIIQIFSLTSPSAVLSVDLSNGTAANADDADIDDYTIEAIAGGWYRASVTMTATTTGNVTFGMAMSDGSPGTGFDTYLGDGTSGLYIWGAQVVAGSSKGHYIKTESSSITLSCDATAGKENLLVYSEQFDNAAWTKTRTSISADAILAPDGTISADKLVEDTSNDSHYIFGQAAVVTGNQYTFSIYAKQAERSIIQIFSLTSPSAVLSVDLSNGTAANDSDADIDDYTIEAIAGGWYRASVTMTATTTGNVTFGAALSDGSPGTGFDGYLGDGSSGLYIWGAQVVTGAIKGEYFKTTSSTHTGSVGSACYNTRITCQDTANYTKLLKSYRFCTAGALLPVGDNMIPCAQNVTLRSPEINPVESIGVRGSATITLDDFPHHDRNIDPYVETRSYIPDQQGTFFGKLRSRNPYYIGRTMRVLTGFLSGGFVRGDFLQHVYQIESMTGPDSSGKVIFKAKDPLKLTEKERATCPTANSGELAAAITGAPSTFTLSPTGIGDSEYDASGYVRIEDEIIQFTRSGDVMTVVSRATWGTASGDHSAGEKVQQCKAWTDTNVVDIVDDLIRDFTVINPAFIDDTGWAEQKGGFLSQQNLTTILSEPEGVDDLLNELIRDNLFDLWWSDRESLIKIRSFIPYNVNTPPAPLNDTANFIQGKTKRIDRHDRRISQVWVIYNPRDYSKLSDDENYKSIHITADTDAEGGDQYGEQRIKKIRSRWFDDTNRAQTISLAFRVLQRYVDAPIELNFTMDSKDDDLAIADHFRTNTRYSQDVDGSNLDQWMQVISVQDQPKDGRVNYKALSMTLIGPYGNIAPDTQVDYDSASDDEKADYAIICLDTGKFSNGDDGYLIL